MMHFGLENHLTDQFIAQTLIEACKVEIDVDRFLRFSARLRHSRISLNGGTSQSCHPTLNCVCKAVRNESHRLCHSFTDSFDQLTSLTQFGGIAENRLKC